ncbi:hypothetical protein ACGFMK_10995 [Amycolatopsis sp. NPDC049252]|uniref:hypothetical protein n=1 Tax=Amycolatopsis sp. NPDC049252 TaxID=3363933 RepID=UPI00371AE6B5
MSEAPRASDPQHQLEATLVSATGGYLRNTLRIPGETCLICTTTVNSGDTYCWPCASHRSAGSDRPTADYVGILTYAIESSQSHYVMRGYKAPQPVRVKEHWNIVSLLCFVGLWHHMRCVEQLAGRRITHWATVPSLPAKSGEHPLHALVRPMLSRLPELALTAATKTAAPRAFRADHFRAVGSLPPGSHVLVIDDTWTSGGHAQSAALTARRAGATTVSVLSLARYFKPTYGDNKEFIAKHLTRDYDPTWCPWTDDGSCSS